MNTFIMNYKIFFPLLLAGLCAAVSTLRAQDCASGFCPQNVVIHHVQGKYSAKTVDLTYNFVPKTGASGDSYCWLDRNIGATSVAANYNASYTTYGWYYPWFPQENMPPGYTNNGTTLILPAYDFDVISDDPQRTTDLSPDDNSDVCDAFFGGAVVPSNAELADLVSKIATSVTTSSKFQSVMRNMYFPASGLTTATTAASSMNILDCYARSTSVYMVRVWTRTAITFDTYTRGILPYLLNSSGTYYDRMSYVNTGGNSNYYYLRAPIRCIIKL